MDRIEKALALVQDVLNDHGVPRNVKASLEKSVKLMKEDKETDDVKIFTAISVLDEASNDPNLSTYARTKIWDVVSRLEELNNIS